MKAVSLFAGVGGFDLALIQNGAEVVASVEIDKHARKILEKQFPTTTHLEDVKNVTGKQLFDLGFNSDGIIVGGFPCQDVSVAGKRAGLSDSNGNATRSGLFWEVVRLLEETKAQHFILENVPGLLSSNEGRDFAVVLNALVELGYGVSWRILDAQYFGVPQRRRRIFIVGCLGGSYKCSGQVLDIEGGIRENLESNEQNEPRTRSNAQSSFKNDYVTYSKVRRAQTNTDFETWVERNYTNTLNAFDNASESRATELLISKDLFSTTCIQCGNDDSTVNHPFCMDCIDIGYREWKFLRRLLPVEFERLQGFPDGWTDGQADSHRYKQMGNAVAVPVVSWIVNRLMGAANDLD
jgi:DNA (cytosine-5)-methyltransferase 1